MHHRHTQETAVIHLAQVLDKTAGMEIAVADGDLVGIHGFRQRT